MPAKPIQNAAANPASERISTDLSTLATCRISPLQKCIPLPAVLQIVEVVEDNAMTRSRTNQAPPLGRKPGTDGYGKQQSGTRLALQKDMDLSLIRESTGNRLLATIAAIVGVFVIVAIFRIIGRVAFPWDERERPRFWLKQIIRIAALVAIIGLMVAIWFDDLSHVGSIAGLITAGVAVSLQRVITSIAAYFIILRSRLFTVGDRITIGGVRGDVVALGFTQTTVLEMGQTPPEQGDAPSMWIHGRQYTGRIVRITNDKIFDTPVYNFTREFPYIWEEVGIPVKYDADHARAEKILLDAATRHTAQIVEKSREQLAGFMKKYPVHGDLEVEPRVFWRMTDNWVELTVRFVAEPHGVRALKDAMARDIVSDLAKTGIGIASSTFEVTGVPPLKARVEIAPESGQPGTSER
jgi:small-conductance mechanosensitive channel